MWFIADSRVRAFSLCFFFRIVHRHTCEFYAYTCFAASSCVCTFFLCFYFPLYSWLDMSVAGVCVHFCLNTDLAWVVSFYLLTMLKQWLFYGAALSKYRTAWVLTGVRNNLGCIYHQQSSSGTVHVCWEAYQHFFSSSIFLFLSYFFHS